MDIFNPFEFFDFVYEWVTVGIYDLFKDAIIWLMAKLLILYFDAAASSIEFAWDIASGILDQLDLSSEITSAFSTLSPTSSQALAFFRIPECINTVLSAFGTRLVLKMIPFV